VSKGQTPRRRLRLHVEGVVQGVGFRPFVYRIAVHGGLSGFVRNAADGVWIEVEGPGPALRAFARRLRDDAPPASRIDAISSEEVPVKGEGGFGIVASGQTAQAAEFEETTLVSPDLATCSECLAELRNPADRRYRYPFINCTNCGPRFTIIAEVPYDRQSTTMRCFKMCRECQAEYDDPLDRRYHAQPNACSVCGPRVWLVSDHGRARQIETAVESSRDLLSKGAVLAVKGLGGFHLCCDATDEAAVVRLRQRKGRPHRPLALLVRDLEVARRLCLVSDAEARELSSPRRPILLLERREARGVAPSVAPSHRFLGLMLPPTPLHHLLLAPGAPDALVATSGNRSGGPIAMTNETAMRDLGHVADAFLLHDRDIWNRCDDSVGHVSSVVLGLEPSLVLLRRSRGYAPLPLALPSPAAPTLALGALLAGTVAIARGPRAFLSQHIGDTDDQETVDFLRETVIKLQRWLGIEPEIFVRDLHPDLPTSHVARELAAAGGFPVVAVQHHHAHLAAAMVAAGSGPGDEAIGLVLDGTGLGLDGTVWGGEILVGNAASARRAGHLRPLPLPGGDAAIVRPVRTAAAWLFHFMPEAEKLPLGVWDRLHNDEGALIRRMVERSFRTPFTSSAGRLFDVVSALLGVRDEVSYEGQAAIELEQAAWGGHRENVQFWPEFEIDSGNGGLFLDPEPFLRWLVGKVVAGKTHPNDLALAFHDALGSVLVRACVRLVEEATADRPVPRRVALAGGVFHNRILVGRVAEGLRAEGFFVLLPGRFPAGDGALPLGQVAVANALGPGRPGTLE
jgi:hydrogenase maturation protein HypF